MIGIIVMGHGNFATGITSSLNLLVGEIENYKAIDFLSGDTTEILEDKLKKSMYELQDCNEFIIYTDLTGGSPFNTAIKLKFKTDINIEVIGGANLTSIIEGYTGRMLEKKCDDIVNDSVLIGKSELIRYMANLNDEIDYEE